FDTASSRQVERVLRSFARAVISGRARRICRLLRGDARRSCGDLGPPFRLTIRREDDVRLVAASRSNATGAFPRLGRDARGAPRATSDDPGPGAYARLKCGRAVQARTVVVELEFPAMRPSASLSQGRVLISRFDGTYRAWALVH